MSEELRIRAMDFAIAARTSGEQDIVELAERIYAFLIKDELAALGAQIIGLSGHASDALKQHVDNIQSEQSVPPPIPQQDLGKADQSPKFFVMPADDDTPTRIVRLGA